MLYLDVLPFPLQYVGPVWSAHIGADSAIRGRVGGGVGSMLYLDVLPFPLQYVGPVWSAHIGADSAIRGRVEGGWEYVVFGLSSFPLAVCWPCLECPYGG